MPAFDRLAIGAVRCVFSSAPKETVQRLLDWGSTRPDGQRIAVCDVDLARPAAGIVDDLIRSLANVALAVWPDWYDSAGLFTSCDERSLQSVLDRIASRQAASQTRAVLRSWALAAASQCRIGAAPVVSDFSPTVQLRQLTLAIATLELTLVIRPHAVDKPESLALLSLARDLEWLSRHAGARVAVVLPATWAGQPELDCISWESQFVEEPEPVVPAIQPARDEPLAIVSPIRGRPHPNSPGEQLLASRLRRDPRLASLFEYNMPVITNRGSRYQVDVVWFDGKVAVEIDGYRCHSSRIDFANDRQRDYELQLSGYLVLRLTHDSVMSDVELAIDKIRDLVKLRLNEQLSRSSRG